MRFPDARPRNFTSYRWLPDARILTEKTNLRLKALAGVEGLIDRSLKFARGDLLQRRRRAERDPVRTGESLEALSEILLTEIEHLELIRNEAQLSQALAIYHAVEAHVVLVFHWRLSGLPVAVRERSIQKLHRWPELRRLTSTYFHFSLDDVAGAPRVDRLRRIANAVKHNDGRVTRQLEQATKWPVGERIDGGRIRLDDYREVALRFSSDFTERAETGTRSIWGKPSGQ